MTEQPRNSQGRGDNGFLPGDIERTLDASDSPSAPALDAGQAAAADMPRINGYQFKVKVGEEGQGSVWRAVQLSTGREVALKFLRAGAFSTDSARARFEREVRLTARLNHRNITAVYDSGILHGAYYYAMEFVDGVHLDQYVRDHKLDQRGILALMRPVCQAVQHAHQRGVIHRDLKPSNILVTSDGQPHVLDFGLAKTVSEGDHLRVSMEGDAPGTLPYMSPEQAAGKVDELDTRTDIYSLGVILFNLLTRRFPHELTGTVVEIRRRIAEEPELRPRTACPSIDRELEALLLKALAHEPDERYESAAELAHDIDNYLGGEPLIAQPHTVFYFLGKRLRKYRLHVGVAAAVALMLLGMAIFAYVRVTLERNRAEASAEASRRALYFTTVNLAQSELDHHKIGQVKELLAACPPDLRGWEWHRLQTTHDQSVRTLGDVGARVFSVAVSPDGTRILAVGKDGLAVIYDATSGRKLHELRGSTASSPPSGHQGIAYSGVFAPSGKLAATAGADGMVRLWDTATGQAAGSFRAQAGNVSSVAINTAGDRLATGGDAGTVKIFAFPGGREVLSLRDDKYPNKHPRDVNAVAFSPDGRFLVSGGADKDLLVWDAVGGDRMAVLSGHEAAVYSIAFSPDGKLMASGGADSVIRLWDAGHFRELIALRAHANYVTSVCFTADSRHLVSASWDRTLKVWEVPEGNELASLRGHALPISTLAVWPTGGRLVSGGQDQTVKLWDLDAHADLVLRGHGDFVFAAAFAQQGRRAVTAVAQSRSDIIPAGTDLKLWDAQTGRRLRDFGTAFSASAATTAASAPASSRASPQAGVYALAVLPDGQRFISAGADGQVRVWDVQTGEPLRTLGTHKGPALSLAVSRDGARIASGGIDGAVQIWDGVPKRDTARLGSPAQGRRTGAIDGLGGPVHAIAFSGDGQRLAVGAADGTVRIYDSGGRQIASLAGHGGTVLALAFAPDGSRLASGGQDKTVRLWDLSAGKEFKILSGHTAPVYCVAFNADSSRLVTGSEDRTVRLWNTWSGLEAMSLHGHAGAVWSVSFSPDGKKILSSSADGTARIWNSGW